MALTKRELINALEALDVADDTVIYAASDDEGNSYNQLSYHPSIGMVDKRDEYRTESYIPLDSDDCNYAYYRNEWGEDYFDEHGIDFDELGDEPHEELDKAFKESLKETHIQAIIF